MLRGWMDGSWFCSNMNQKLSSHVSLCYCRLHHMRGRDQVCASRLSLCPNSNWLVLLLAVQIDSMRERERERQKKRIRESSDNGHNSFQAVKVVALTRCSLPVPVPLPVPAINTIFILIPFSYSLDQIPPSAPFRVISFSPVCILT